jgi:O-6-methylguanine DNA methyltransferase
MIFTTCFCSWGSACIVSSDSLVVGVELGKTHEQALFQAMLRFENVKTHKQFNHNNEEIDSKILNLINSVVYAVNDFDNTNISSSIYFITGTPFQHEVWRAISQTKIGETISYKQLAEKIGKPNAVRAVASACGQNPLAVVIPCHRVIRSNKEVGQYHWGIETKLLLLEEEQFLIRLTG